MPGRPRLYLDDAERQREHRARQKQRRAAEQDRSERLRASLRELRAALELAAAAGDPLAQTALHPGINELLLNLASHFRQQAAAVPAVPAGAAAPAAAPPSKAGPAPEPHARRPKRSRKEPER